MTQHEITKQFGDALIERNNGGIHVALFYSAEESLEGKIETFCMLYEDFKDGFSASFEIPKARVLDAWHHPFAFVIAAQHSKPLATVAA